MKGTLKCKQRDLELLSDQREHNYSRIPSWCSQQSSRFLVASSERLNQIEVRSKSFSNNMQEWQLPDIDLFASKISHQVPTYISWKFDPFSKRRDAFQITWTHLKEYTFPPFALTGRAIKCKRRKQLCC